MPFQGKQTEFESSDLRFENEIAALTVESPMAMRI